MTTGVKPRLAALLQVPGAAIPAGGVGLLSLSPVWQDGFELLFTTQ